MEEYLGGVVEDARLGLGDGALFMSGEKDELAEVATEALLVEVELLLGFVLSSVVDGDADGLGELDSETDCFDFGKGESSSESGSVVVPDGLAPDGGSKSIEGSGGDGSGSIPSGL